MTMNIINEIKIENRKKSKHTKTTKNLQKLKKTLRPLKYFSLFILLFLPVFKMPAWCIDAQFYEPSKI